MRDYKDTKYIFGVLSSPGKGIAAAKYGAQP